MRKHRKRPEKASKADAAKSLGSLFEKSIKPIERVKIRPGKDGPRLKNRKVDGKIR